MRRLLAGIGVLGLVALPVVVFVLCSRDDAFTAQAGVVLSADPQRYGPGVRHGVVVDLGFVAAFLTGGLAAVLVARHWLPPFRRFAGPPDARTGEHRSGGPWWNGGVAIGAAAGLDLLENALLALAGDSPPPGWFAVVIAVVGWWKWAAYVAAFVVLVVVALGTTLGAVGSTAAEAGLGWLSTKFSRTPDTSRHAEPLPGAVHPDRLAICVSGGGIRAASVALGALRRFDQARPGGSLFRRASWLLSVSGGGFTAGGWRISRQLLDTTEPRPDPERDGLFDRGGGWSTWVADHCRYLTNGPFGLVRAALAGLVRCALVLGAVGGAALVLGWVAGQFVNWGPVVGGALDRSALPELTSDEIAPYVRWQLWLPGALPLAVAALALLPTSRRNRVVTLAGGAGVALLGVLFVLPFVIGLGPSLLLRIVEIATPLKSNATDSGSGLGAVLAVVSGLGVGTALGGLVTRRLQKVWLRLGGFLLGVLLAVVLVTTARAVATGTGVRGGNIDIPWFGTVPWLVVASLAVLAVVSVWDSHRITLAGIYRQKLGGTFATRRRCCRTSPIPYEKELAWSNLTSADGPELVICATVQSSTETVSGLRGAGLTFSARAFTMYDGTPGGCAVPSGKFPVGSAWRGYPRVWSVSRALAISGAAVASSMGRQGLGTTNALIAATNIRLGMWLPNPSRLDLFQDRKGGPLPQHLQPRVGLSYLAKEIFGRYDLATDPFVYVADGGHRENLALVEALRFQPEVVFAVDASGDRPGTFKTLQEAIDLARVELGITITMAWDPILTQPAQEGAPVPVWPSGCATTGTIEYPDKTVGRLFYGRHQLSGRAPAALRAFAAEHPGFPNYSTVNQFLTREVHLALVALGEHVGDEIVRLHDGAEELTRPARTPAGSAPCRAGRGRGR